MIFAAGRGRRLRPLTDATPKALVDFGGVPLLERVAGNLVAAGAHRLIVNAHYLAEQVAAWAEASSLGVPVFVSREDEESPAPLDTSGGLFHARSLFEGREPFLLHNCDVATDVDLAALYRAHVEGEARDGRLATLAIAERGTSRPLLVDGRGVCGRANRDEGWEVVAREPSSADEAREYGFCGIHAIAPRVFERYAEGGVFSIMDSYMDWIGDGEHVAVFDATGAAWYDIGTPERLDAARRAFGASASADGAAAAEAAPSAGRRGA
ncbi:sugar phosphate nucleotidyltransferase [Candidatus Palauibacter sp.]|uniref:sugar phosphate nucleotidyltransferase n=1 Tax=Candidatus Palauibacter sp. TaxID=3101350 RepID=UPI003D0A0B26